MRPVLLLIALLLSAACARAQTTPAPALQPGPGEAVATIQADSVVSTVENGQAVQRLFSTRGGIVAVQQGATTVTAASAVAVGPPGRRTITLTGAVRILQDSDVLEAPTVRYDEATRTGTASGGVRLSNTDVTVTSEAVRYDARSRRADFDQPVRLVTTEDGSVLTAARGTYFAADKRADFAGNVRLVDSTSVLTAARGSYFTDTRKADFSGDVRLVDASTTLTAQRGTYDRNTTLATFEGNVRLVDSTAVLTAERGTYDRTSTLATFEGNVQLQDSTATLTARRGTYDRTATLATFEGNVQLQDSVSTLTARQGTYDRTRRFATFEGNVQLVDSTSVLTADRGTYDRREERADFSGNVQLTRRKSSARTDETNDVFAERLTYYRRDERADADGAFRLDRTETDSTGAVRVRTLLLGGRIRNDDRAGVTVAERVGGAPEPLLVRLVYPPLADSTAAPDTLVLRAATLRLDRAAATDTSLALQTLRARGDVRLWSRRYAATADSLFSRRSGPDAAPTDSLRLLRRDAAGQRPLGFLRRAEVSSDTLALVAEDGEARRLHALGSAFVAQQDSATGRFQQAKGDRLRGTFDGGDRRRFVLGPRAELLFFRSSDGRPDGAVRASGDHAEMQMVGDSLRALDVFDGIEGVYIPEALGAASERLDGFGWHPERRPTFEALTRGYALPRLDRPPSRPRPDRR